MSKLEASSRSFRSLPFLLGLFVVAACSSEAKTTNIVGSTSQAIINGTTDTTHTAVVAVLSLDPSDQNSFGECTGEVVQVKGGNGYVLTAAHCCGGDPSSPGLTPSIVVEADDYSNYEQDLGVQSPAAPAYGVVSGSVQWDQAYTQSGQLDHDFCMLQFANAPANMPTLKLPTSTDDGLGLNTQVELVGYGKTDSSNNNMNSARYHVTIKADVQVDAYTMKYNMDDQNGKGACEGDSGGPALIPAGAAQSAQTIVATTSYGTSTTCTGENVSSRVSSEIGPNGFITNYLAGTPISGAEDGGTSVSCDSCEEMATSVGGGCASAINACEANTDCSNLLNCLDNCSSTSTTCSDNCASTYSAGIDGYNAIFTCVCNTACTSQCASICSTSSGGTDAGTTGTSSKDAGSSSSSSSSSGSDGGSSSSGSTGTGTGGDTSGGDSSGGSSGQQVVVTHKSGCSVASAGSSSSSSNGLLSGGLLFGLALFSRRRRAKN